MSSTWNNHCRLAHLGVLAILLLSFVSLSAVAEVAETPAFSLSFQTFAPTASAENDFLGNGSASASTFERNNWLSMTAAILPGYLIPAAFGQISSGRNLEAALVSMARLSGRVMWMFSLFSSLLGKGSDGSFSKWENAALMAGVGLDFGGYFYDVSNSPHGVRSYGHLGKRVAKAQSFTFLRIVNKGPCCGLVYRF